MELLRQVAVITAVLGIVLALMPAVLVEVGFVTNPDEARLLSSAAGQEQTARAIFEAVRDYKASYESGLRFGAAE